MKKEKTYQYLLVALLFFGLLVLTLAFYFFGYVIPQKAVSDFGEPDANFDHAKRVVSALRLELNRDDLLKPVQSNAEEVIFTVTYGESAMDIAENLATQKLLRSAEIFTNFLVYRGIDGKIQSGIYSLNPAMNALEIADHLVDANPEDVAFSFLAGWRAEEIAALLPSSGLEITPDEFLQDVKQPGDDYSLPGFTQITTLEGFLFPDEYQVIRTAGSQTLLDAFNNGFISHLPADYESRLKQKGLDLYKGVTLASIVQKEMVLDEEGPIIASVFINRLKVGMPLQSDPTVQYALGYDQASNSWWKNPLSASDLQVDSPFNTYLNSGLPPAPICNPDLDALLAVMNAPDTNYLYFRTACDGSSRHVFSETYEQHLAAECK